MFFIKIFIFHNLIELIAIYLFICENKKNKKLTKQIHLFEDLDLDAEHLFKNRGSNIYNTLVWYQPTAQL